MILLPEQDLSKLRSRDLVKIECTQCNKIFTIEKHFAQAVLKGGTNKNKYKYCSSKCFAASKVTSVTSKCGYCDNEVTRNLHEKTKSKSGICFCSHSCSAAYSNINNKTRKFGPNKSKCGICKWCQKDIEKYKRACDLCAEKDKASGKKICKVCNGNKVSSKNDMCFDCLDKRKRILFKSKCVDYLGGCCKSCGYNKSLSSLQFHHINPKTKKFGISRQHKRAWKEVQQELDKCILLCSNCHREKHISNSGSRDSINRYKNKSKAVAMKGGKCERCEYNKEQMALDFHHLNPSEDDILISQEWRWEKIETELNKCILICSNCHCEEHERQSGTHLFTNHTA